MPVGREGLVWVNLACGACLQMRLMWRGDGAVKGLSGVGMVVVQVGGVSMPSLVSPHPRLGSLFQPLWWESDLAVDGEYAIHRSRPMRREAC